MDISESEESSGFVLGPGRPKTILNHIVSSITEDQFDHLVSSLDLPLFSPSQMPARIFKELKPPQISEITILRPVFFSMS